MQFAKLTSDVFEVARLPHPFFRQRFEPFDFKFERSYFCFNLFAGVAHHVLPDQLQSLQRNSSKRCAFLFSSTWEANMPLLLWLLGVPLVLVVVLWMLHVV